MNFRAWFKKTAVKADKYATDLQAATSAGVAAQGVGSACASLAPVIQTVSHALEDSGQSVVAATTFSAVGALAGVATWPLALAAGLTVLGCKIMTRNAAAKDAAWQKGMLNHISALVASQTQENRDQYMSVLRRLEKLQDQFNGTFPPLDPELLDAIDEDAIARDLGIDLKVFDAKFKALETRLDQIALDTEESRLAADAILTIVAETTTVQDLQSALNPIYEQLIRTFEEQIGLEIPKKTANANPAQGQTHLLRYNERLAEDLIARESEFQILEEFLDDPAPFRWLALTGYGGAGKSRLALEFILRHQETHHVGFVKKEGRATKLSDFLHRHWPHDKPVILVFDYIQADASAIAEFLAKLTEEGWDRKVRVILVDRIFTGYSYTQPFTRRIGSHGYTVPQSDKNELRLDVLALEEFAHVFQRAYKAINGGPPPPEYDAKIRAAFEEKPRDRLPLLATLAALFAALNPNAMAQGTEWSTRELKQWYFEHYFRDHLAREHYQSALHALYLATCVGGTNRQWHRWVHDKKVSEFGTDGWPLAQQMVGGERPNDPELPPVEPDPLGEYFAGERLVANGFGEDVGAEIGYVSAAIFTALLHQEAPRDDNALAALERMIPVVLRQPDALAILGDLRTMPDALKVVVGRNLNSDELRDAVNALDETDTLKFLPDTVTATADAAASAVGEQPWREELRVKVERLDGEFTKLEAMIGRARIDELRAYANAAIAKLDRIAACTAGAPEDILRLQAQNIGVAGKVAEVLGDYVQMGQRAGMALGLARRAVTEFGESPEALRDLSASLTRVGDFDLQVRGDSEAAEASYRESLEVRRRIVADFGESAQSLRDLSVSLERVGDFDLTVRGDAEAAEASFRELLVTSRRIVAEFGESPQSLRDLSVSLIRVGDFDLKVREDREAAEASYREALEICRRIVAEFGETPQSLRDLSVSLNKVGDFDLNVRGDREAAEASYRESLEIARRIVTEFRETPQSLRDLSVSLERVGDFDLNVRGDAEAAAASYRDALKIARRIVAAFGETPLSLRDLSVSLNKVGDFDLKVREDREAAEASYREALEICRRIVAEFGDSPQSLEDLIPSLVRIASLAQDPAPYWLEAYVTIVRRNRRFDPNVQSKQWESNLLRDLKALNIPIPDVD